MKKITKKIKTLLKQTKLGLFLFVSCLLLMFGLNHIAVKKAVEAYAAMDAESIAMVLSSHPSIVEQVLAKNPQLIEAAAGKVKNEEIKAILYENPNFIVNAFAKYKFKAEQQKTKLDSENIKRYKEELEGGLGAPYLGNPNGNLIISKFNDPNCGYCKKVSKEIEKLIKVNKMAKVYIVDYPVFNYSLYAIKVGIAISQVKPEIYGDFYSSLMSASKPSDDDINDLVERLGLNIDELKSKFPYAEQQIKRNQVLATKLNVQGTPAIFANQKRFGSSVTAEQLIQAFK